MKDKMTGFGREFYLGFIIAMAVAMVFTAYAAIEDQQQEAKVLIHEYIVTPYDFILESRLIQMGFGPDMEQLEANQRWVEDQQQEAKVLIHEYIVTPYDFTLESRLIQMGFGPDMEQLEANQRWVTKTLD